MAKITCGTRPPGAGLPEGDLKRREHLGVAIRVRPEMKRRAFSIAPALAGTASGNTELAVELNRMTLNRSVGWSLFRASRSASRACAIDVPDIEPEVSMTKIVSRGSRDATASGAPGGMTIRRSYRSPSTSSE